MGTTPLRRPLSGVVLAAERRDDGAVVYLDFAGDWHEDLAVAAVARAADERRALADRAAYETQRATMLRPRLLEVSECCGRVSPRTPARAARTSVARPSCEGLPVASVAVAAADDGAGGCPPPVRELARGDAPGGYPPWAA
jgi:hypothetical protein